ncbi:cytochrome B6 [Cyanobium sp. ATX 6A2]|uniref:cytochrome B6 n=1 Tax=Cyanobium sp. ATX 6A2 TaxID=2823700 RepID=UPI0020CD05D5|nr:cytochrome B6 [Cyanobium sp. ATX 6A2]MCP9886858.1 cytochrome B6 [Cyanobium sp. ATX 6A2]
MPSPSPVLALSTASDAAAGLPFGLDISTLQTYVLLYLGLSSLVFVVVWVVGYVRSR